MTAHRHIALAGLFLLGACGGGGGGATTGGTPTPAPSPTSQAPSTTLVPGAPTLVVSAAGTNQGVDYDTVKVAGRATVSGNLQFEFTNGFRPAAGQRFVVLTATGGLTGRFDAVNAQGFAYTMAYDANGATVVIS